jgi:hypothetical protein
MSLGPGKYDDLCTYVREQSEAGAAIVIVIGGNKGAGFSCQITDPVIMTTLPNLLEHMARQIRADQRE